MKPTHRHHFLLASSVLMCLFTTDISLASQYEITGFRYDSCRKDGCVQINSRKAWLSQINGGFFAEGAVTMKILKANSEVERSEAALRATYQPLLDEVVLDKEDGSILMVSLKTGLIRTLGSANTETLRKYGVKR